MEVGISTRLDSRSGLVYMCGVGVDGVQGYFPSCFYSSVVLFTEGHGTILIHVRYSQTQPDTPALFSATFVAFVHFLNQTLFICSSFSTHITPPRPASISPPLTYCGDLSMFQVRLEGYLTDSETDRTQAYSLMLA